MALGQPPTEAHILNRRSWVRVGSTWGAAAYLFLFGPALIGALVCLGEVDKGIDLFMTLLPVASAIVAFWFSGRAGKAPEAPRE